MAQRIRTILDRAETFGARRVWAWLRFQEGVGVHQKTGPRIMPRKGWQCRLWHRPPLRPKPTWEQCSTVDQPDQRWATDTTKIRCGRDGWASLVGVLDAGRCECVWGPRFARQGRAIGAIDALEQGILQVPEGLRLRHDNGVIERFFRTLKQECVWLHQFESFEDAERIIMAWIAGYHTARQRSALGCLTPCAWGERFYQLPQEA